MKHCFETLLSLAENYAVMLFLSQAVLLAGYFALGGHRRTHRLPALRAARLAAGMLLLPHAVTAMIVLPSFLPMLWRTATMLHRHGAVHENHLFSALLSPAFPVFPLFVVGLAAFVCFQAGFRQRRALHRIENMGSLSADEFSSLRPDPLRPANRGNCSISVVRCEIPLGMVVGWFRPRIIVSTGMIDLLDAPELDGMLRHERAHARRRDNIMRRALHIASKLTPFRRTARHFYQHWCGWAEIRCDEMAARQSGQPVTLASAILHVHRWFERNRTAVHATAFPAFCSEDGSLLEHRIANLLKISKFPCLKNEGVMSRWGVLAAVSLGFLLLAVTLSSPHSVHCIVESFLPLP